MNLNAYDAIEQRNCVIDAIKKQLYIKNIKYKKYYSFLTRYDKDNNFYTYYILFSDSKIDKENIKTFYTNKLYKDKISISLNYIIDKLPINKNERYNYVELVIEEKDDDKELYRLVFDL